MIVLMDRLVFLCAGGAGVRSMIMGLGSGIGIGMTYADAKRDFEELAPRKSVAAKETS